MKGVESLMAAATSAGERTWVVTVAAALLVLAVAYYVQKYLAQKKARSDMDLVFRAATFAAEKFASFSLSQHTQHTDRHCSQHCNTHRHQTERRKGGNDIPYINHPLEVAAVLAAAGVTDAEVLAAALLHDTLEDTATTAAELAAHFGPRVRRIVEQCTDDKTQPYLERKRGQIAHAPLLPDDAKCVKLADKIANMRSMLVPGGSPWNAEVTQGYAAWARAVCAGLRGANARLDAVNDAIWGQSFTLADGSVHPLTPPDMTQEEVLARYYAIKKTSY